MFSLLWYDLSTSNQYTVPGRLPYQHDVTIIHLVLTFMELFVVRTAPNRYDGVCNLQRPRGV